MMTSNRQFIFTMTAGRTGSTYLAELLQSNLHDAEIYHEILAYDAFGVDTPDLSHFTLFNSQGNVPEVQAFWTRKFQTIRQSPARVYGETSHLLMKAGLIENLHKLWNDGAVSLIVLKRDFVETIVSYRKRFDFLNKGNMWLWYLDPDYPRKIVDSKPFLPMGVDGICLWYLCEMAARTEFYKLQLADNPRVQVHEVNLAHLNDPARVAALLDDLGVPRAPGKITLPAPQNVARPNVNIPDSHVPRRITSRILESSSKLPKGTGRRAGLRPVSIIVCAD
jgi:hypothetical protein